MPKPNKTEDRPLDEKSWRAKILEVQDLYASEQILLKTVREKSQEATVLAFKIGKVIYGLERGYRKNAVERFAEACGCFKAPTARDYEYLYRGAVDEEHIHPPLNRDYLQALGRIVDGYFGEHAPDRFWKIRRIVHYTLLTKPLLLGEGADAKINVIALKEVGRLLTDFKGVIRETPELDFAMRNSRLDWKKIGGMEGYVIKLAVQVPKNSALSFYAELERLLGDVYRVGGYAGIAFSAKDRIFTPDGKKITPHPPLEEFETRSNRPPPVKAEISPFNRRHRATDATINQGTVDARDLDWQDKIKNDRSDILLKDNSFLEPGSVDVVLTDPPYSDQVYKQTLRRDGKTSVKHDAPATAEEAGALIGRVADLLVEQAILKEKFIWFNFFPLDWAVEFVQPVLKAFRKRSVPVIHQVLVWHKNGAQLDGGRYFRRDAEGILYINGGNRPLSPTFKGVPKSMYSSVFKCSVNTENSSWKPGQLLEDLILMSTYEAKRAKAKRQIILDPFAGSGSTAIAAINCHRDYRMIESNDGQFDTLRKNLRRENKKAPSL